jgi:hypothetical protein
MAQQLLHDFWILSVGIQQRSKSMTEGVISNLLHVNRAETLNQG